MKRCLAALAAACVVVSISSQVSAWEDLECIYMGGDWIERVPTSCAEVCTSSEFSPENMDWLNSVYVKDYESQHQSGLPFIFVDNCWVHQWACANGYESSFSCFSASAVDKNTSIGVGVSKPYYDEEGNLEPLRAPKESTSKVFEGGEHHFKEGLIKIGGGEGLFSETVSMKHSLGDDDCESENRRAGGSVRFWSKVISVGYEESYAKAGYCSRPVVRDGVVVDADNPVYKAFEGSPAAALGALESFVGYLLGKTNELYSYAKTGQMPDGTAAAAGVSEAVGIVAEVRADGYEPESETWATDGFDPSQVMVMGFVRDQNGAPVADATVSLPDLGATIVTDAFGRYRLSAEAAGERPFITEWNPVLKKRVGEIEIRVDTRSQDVIVPTKAGAVNKAPLTVHLEDCTERAASGRCVPLREGRVEIELVNDSALPMVSLDAATGMVGTGGSYRTALALAHVDDAGIDLGALWNAGQSSGSSPLEIELQVRAFLKDGTTPKKESTFTIPLDLMLIRGTTVDQNMSTFNEPEPPFLKARERAWVTSQLDQSEVGVFYVLVQPSKASGDPQLTWKATCSVPLVLPFTVLEEVRGITPGFVPGETVDIGNVDMLTPDEHVRRLKNWIREFLPAMGFDNGYLQDAVSSLSTLWVRYEVPGITVPRYGLSVLDSSIGDGGQIQVGVGSGEYWGTNAFIDDDPPYTIFLHELGHYVHKKIGDRWLETCLWGDKNFTGAEHGTWETPTTTVSETGKLMTSFFEGTADFFAYSMFKFVESRHPEMKDSLYFRRGYLEEFDSSEKAMGAVHLGGCRVEGIQTTFLRAVYDSYLDSSPARAFGDFLRMVDAFKSESWVMRWVPARSIPEWVAMKRKHGGMAPSAGLEGLVRQYAIEACEAGIMVYPADPRATTRIAVNGRSVTLSGKNVAQSLVIGQTVKVEQGVVAILVQIWGRGGETRVFAASQGTAFTILSADQVTDHVGTVVIDGKIAVKTEGGTVTPAGTSFLVEVSGEGDAAVKVLEGTAELSTRKKTQRIAEGRAASISRRGKIREAPSFDPQSVKNSFVAPEQERREAAVAAADPTPAPVAASQGSGGSFIAARRKATGDCVVVFGVEGLSPGDQVLGSFGSHEEAQAAAVAACGGPGTSSAATRGGSPLTMEIILRAENTVTRGAYGGVTPLNRDGGIDARAAESGLPIDNGFATHPGSGGATEIHYRHDGSPEKLSGLATILDCLSYCGGAGTMIFRIEGDARTLWQSPLIRHRDPAQPFSVDLAGVRDLRLVATDGGNGISEDWGAWVNLRLGEHAQTATVPVPVQPLTIQMTGETPSFTSPVLAVPKIDDDESTKGIFFINLDSGNAFFIDKVKRSPLEVRTRSLDQNVFEALGRLHGVPARPGEILVEGIRSGDGKVHALFLVETTSGAASYITSLGRHSYSGRLRPVSGRPAAHLAADDGNFVLMAKQSGSGATEGAYLYHGTSGQCLYFHEIGRLRTDLMPPLTTPLPRMRGRASGLGLVGAGEATEQLLLVDDGTGQIFLVGELKKKAAQLSVVPATTNLYTVFPQTAEVATPQRFVLVPIFAKNGATESVFVIDAGSGRMAILRRVSNPRSLRLENTGQNIYDSLTKTVGRGRTLTAVPKVRGSGATEGAWVFDSVTGDVLYLEDLADPRALKVHRVQQKAR